MDDANKEWRADGVFGGTGGGRDNNRREGRSRGNNVKDFGPKGHDYSMANDAGPIKDASVSEAEIDALIAERLQFKLKRNYGEADRIQGDLAHRGVFVHDGRKEWRADGENFGESASGGRMNGMKPGRERNNNPYEMSDYSNQDNLTDEDREKIEDLVARRVSAKLSRDYDTADNLRDQLIREYNVKVEDRLRQWSIGSDFGENNDRNTSSNRNSNPSNRPDRNPRGRRVRRTWASMCRWQ